MDEKRVMLKITKAFSIVVIGFITLIISYFTSIHFPLCLCDLPEC